MTAERRAPAPAPREDPVLTTTPFYPLRLKYSRKEDSQEKEMGEAVMSANTFLKMETRTKRCVPTANQAFTVPTPQRPVSQAQDPG